MDNNVVVIGVDVGNGYTKTANTEFVSSVTDYGELKPALNDRLLKYNNKYYIVGGDRTKTKTDQKQDDTAFILALAGIGEELNRRGIGDTHLVLSEGLPLERCHKENQIADIEYYKKGETIYFEYEDVPHTIVMDDVIVSAQCVAGIADLVFDGAIPSTCIVVDIGSWTMDILPIENGRSQFSKVRSVHEGVINCMLNCNDEIRRRTGREVLESQIQQIMRGNQDALPPVYSKIVVDAIKKYAKNIFDTLTEMKFNVDTLDCIFMGGGATLIQQYGKEYFPSAKYVTNIRANAIGYERIGNQKLGIE